MLNSARATLPIPKIGETLQVPEQEHIAHLNSDTPAVRVIWDNSVTPPQWNSVPSQEKRGFIIFLEDGTPKSFPAMIHVTRTTQNCAFARALPPSPLG